ncbi:Short-chain dehydrogenase/reductase SDR [Penicillium italicum]|uniref:Short-chain dehydrogenase/reductase SDR n=1 Tax=Penicillium italicum TaxID=40296 RepID=A0A0A2L9L3_PENIT|nr:Short-chain dehydrogenase/reductase SDR [Penicillium italicum]
MTKVALITGGASGMGQAVANALSLRNDWEIHILDINSERGTRTANELPRTTFHRADVTKYSDLAAAFQSMFQQHRKLDFVFANAGVIERTNFYSTPQAENARDVCPPPEPDLLSIDADLKGVIFTAYLAQHYFRHSPHKGRDSSLVMTASCGGLYPSFYSPLYSAAKFGVVGFMRSISQHFRASGIRVNAICPGIVRTNLVDSTGWGSFPPGRFIDMETITRLVLQLVDGGDFAGRGLTDTSGRHLPLEELYGVAVEISDSGFYFRDQHAFCDEGMREVMEATVLENQVGAVLNG